MKWVGERSEQRGVAERGFEVTCDGRLVPGVLWTTADETSPAALVLLGHGGSNHKRAAYISLLASRFVRHHGFAAAAIDGPVHGDRRDDGGEGLAVRGEFRRAWERPEMTDEMVADWKATLDALQSLPELGRPPVGYWGLSMGTILGVPLVAAEPRIECAVLGLCGVVPPAEARLRRDAERITCPLLFLQQWDDELFPRERVHELFDRLASQEKVLHANPGRHAEIPAPEFRATEAFLAERLKG